MKMKLPPAPDVDPALWRELYRAALHFQALAPWTWMSDYEVFGIDDPHGVRISSVLGANGELFGLVSYRGTDGTNELLMLRSGIFEPTTEFSYRQDALLALLVSQRELLSEDKTVMKSIAFRPHPNRPRLYPQFRSHLPGYSPWFLDGAEARSLVDTLDKAVLFGTMLREHPDYFAGRHANEVPFFPAETRLPLTPNQLIWHTLVPVFPPPDPEVDPGAFADLVELAEYPQTRGAVWEVEAFFAPARICEPPRPFWSKMGLVADARSGLVLGTHGVGAQSTMAEAAAESLVQALRQHRHRPAALRLCSADLIQALTPLAARLRIEFERADRLPMIERAKESLEAYLSQP